MSSKVEEADKLREKAFHAAYDQCLERGCPPYGIIHAHYYACIMNKWEEDLESANQEPPL